MPSEQNWKDDPTLWHKMKVRCAYDSYDRKHLCVGFFTPTTSMFSVWMLGLTAITQNDVWYHFTKALSSGPRLTSRTSPWWKSAGSMWWPLTPSASRSSNDSCSSTASRCVMPAPSATAPNAMGPKRYCPWLRRWGHAESISGWSWEYLIHIYI